ncbi:MAG: signal peptide peptidase SppA [Acidobacteria bacterium]|nr:signal peptide peptidase SppA [Acidobacteriota bacterium]
MTRKRLRVVALVLLGLLVVAVVGSQLSRRIPSQTVLEITVSGEVAEEPPPNLQARMWMGDVQVLRDVLEALDRARADARIAGVVVRIQPFSMNLAKVQELRAKLGEFGQSGKFSLAFLEDADNRMYYLATACQEIYQVPTSHLGLLGLMASSTFLRSTLDKLHIYPDLYHIAEYKTAKNLLTEKRYTAAHREMVSDLLQGWSQQFVAGIAAGRQLQPAGVEERIRKGPYAAEEAKEAGLVDDLLYADQLRDVLKEKTGRAEPRTISVAEYLARTARAGRHRIAIVHATGAIDLGRSRFDPLLGLTMGSDTVRAALRAAREDASVKAIVFRVDSPGGSATASEVIRREVELAREKKPVIVSMSDVAGSGGYWIAMSANKIVAQPGTITGSIGVVFGKMNVRGFYELLGITKDQVLTAENSTLLYPFENFTPTQRATVQRLMRQIYENFLAGVAEGRKLPLEEVDRIGKGRVWLGDKAQALGLVDELGGLDRAVSLAKELANIPAQEGVTYIIYPRPRSTWEEIQEWFGVRATPPTAAGLRKWFDVSDSLLVRNPVLALVPFDLQVR